MAIQYDEELVKESMELLDEYDYEPERYAVKKILNTWAENKEWIVHLFEHHPNYNGKYQIVFSDTFTREIDRDECRAFYNWILRSDWDTRETAVNGIYASAIFDKLLNWPKRFLDDEDDVIISWLNRFDDHFGAKAGQKVSRVINKLCKMVGLDKATEYNARFARVADALNPIKIVRHTILSVHPVDYWTMSFGNSWASCHTIDKENKRQMPNNYQGCFSSGTESYMLDPSTFVFYTVDMAYSGNEMELQPKINRCMFHLGDDLMVQGRVYPQGNDGNLDMYQAIREICQKVIADCMGVPNLWVNRKGSSECSTVTASYGTHYKDYLCFNDCNVSYLKGTENNEHKLIRIGHDPICPRCGEEHSENENILCPDCSGEYHCADCGRMIDEDDVCWVDGTPYCSNCVNYCDYYEEYTRDEVTYVEGYGNVSDSALENHPEEFQQCERCGEWVYVDGVNGVYVDDGYWYCCEGCAEKDGYRYTEDTNEWKHKNDLFVTEYETYYENIENMMEDGYDENGHRVETGVA